MQTVFLSSTGLDLHTYRAAAFLAIQKLDGWKCVRMEDFEARDGDVDTFCRECVQQCDLFVGVIGHRFGAGPKGSKESYTQREYRAACDAGKPRLLFLAPDNFPIPANLLEVATKIKAQAKFRDKLRKSGDRVVSIGFTSPDDLARGIVTAVYNFVDSSGRKKFDTVGYLNILWEDTAYIDIRGLKVAGEAVHRFRIDQLYTPLTTVVAHPESKLGPGELRDVPLQNALRNKRVVLVGGPGAGKSTFLRRIAFAASETLLGRNPSAGEDLVPEPCTFPLFIRAASLSNHILQNRRRSGCPPDADSPAWLAHYLQTADEGDDRTLKAAFFRDQLDRGCLLLVDGLDQVADPMDRKAIARLIERAARAYPRTQVVVTSRPPAYGGETAIPGFVTIGIAALDDGAVATFVGKWCGALNPSEEKSRAHQRELLEAIWSKPEIRALALNPVMLTAIAALHWNRTRLPDQRTELYDSVLRWLTEAREHKRRALRENLAGRITPSQCLALMQHLAYNLNYAQN